MIERIGVLGGGQLARMLLQAAIPLGLELTILATREDDPAALVARHVVAGDWSDPLVLDAFAAQADIVILENEFVGSQRLHYLADKGLRLVPSAETLAIIEDKARQKQTLAAAGLAVPALAEVETLADVEAAGTHFGWPLMLKTRRNGYDGRGTARINGAEHIETACRSLGWPANPVFVEGWVPFEAELATVVVRSVAGATCVYPVVQTIQPQGVCHTVNAPAPYPADLLDEAVELACAAAEAVDAVGILAVEMFLTKDGQVLINELAPRPHNTGHYSIEGCYTSQFENALRAALGWPLGDPGLRHPHATMVNVLAPKAGPLDARFVTAALTHQQVHVHWYDKRSARVGRKIGHITAVGDQARTVEQRALAALKTLEEQLKGGVA